MRLKGNNKKFKIYSATSLLLIVTIFYFVRITNDHKECGTEKSYATDKAGNQVITVKHICKEKYNI